jgi:hypothetical protein
MCSLCEKPPTSFAKFEAGAVALSTREIELAGSAGLLIHIDWSAATRRLHTEDGSDRGTDRSGSAAPRKSAPCVKALADLDLAPLVALRWVAAVDETGHVCDVCAHDGKRCPCAQSLVYRY